MSEEIPIDDVQLMENQFVNLQTSIGDEARSNLKIDQSTNQNSKEPPHNDKGVEIKHQPYHDDKKSGSRCKFPKCKQLTHVFCKDCAKYLCFTRKRNCFSTYHVEKYYLEN